MAASTENLELSEPLHGQFTSHQVDQCIATINADPSATVFNLPQLYQKPTFDELRSVLESLTLQACSFDDKMSGVAVAPAGVPEYLTQIIASPLLFLSSESERDALWELASQRLSERSGRSALPSMTRTFAILTTAASEVIIQIHEPTLTSDDLGLKTWGTAYVLAQQIHRFRLPLSMTDNSSASPDHRPDLPAVLELGAGTGLAGIAAAAAWGQHVLLTDLPSIVPNLSHNIELNNILQDVASGRASSAVLDWSQPTIITNSSASADLSIIPANHFRVIIAADPIYDPQHPRMLVSTIARHLHPADDVLVLVAYPSRQAYVAQIEELHALLHGLGLIVNEKGRETGRDDWKDDVEVEWLLWVRSSIKAQP